MKLLFNHNNNGQAELKKILGFLDGDFNYTNIEPDIELNTPYLIDLISIEVYDKIQALYESPTQEENLNEVSAVKYCQLYVASMAYLDYAPNNDLSHKNSGRSHRSEENEKQPWEWQIANSNSATKKRAYKALDHLFILLDELAWAEWTSSDAYKKAHDLFIKNTKQFDDVFPINKSGQLYYRLVTFMDDFETDFIIPVVTPTVATALKLTETPSNEQKALLSLIKKAIAYMSLAKAMNSFPVEMFAEGMIYNENTRMKSQARAEVMQYLNDEANNYIKKLENLYAQQNETFTLLETKNGLTEGKKYVNL
ncbi:hypothetical protein ES692_06175 [Psychroserpens burtonensis]|uniref:Uncharacterized protein n=1 Tax=Psychroserpens burtonensis TaxID=49278 RepID=A0A5C7B923_9FLAO|nr:DUF6712 family protein [Psychroserpens burtonensis]TXE18628.1 hypothetical protein ES692_06175 [Psychroserpens burtonensis]